MPYVVVLTLFLLLLFFFNSVLHSLNEVIDLSTFCDGIAHAKIVLSDSVCYIVTTLAITKAKKFTCHASSLVSRNRFVIIKLIDTSIVVSSLTFFFKLVFVDLVLEYRSTNIYSCHFGNVDWNKGLFLRWVNFRADSLKLSGIGVFAVYSYKKLYNTFQRVTGLFIKLELWEIFFKSMDYKCLVVSVTCSDSEKVVI